MERDLEILLGQMESPAFLVQSNILSAVNSASAQYNIETGQNIHSIITIGKEEYEHFTEGNLYLTVNICGVDFDCSVTKLQNADLFILENGLFHTDLQLLSLVAKQLSMPVSDLSVLFSKASGLKDCEKERINKILFQLHRIINNMSDALPLTNSPQTLQTTELCSVLEESLEKARTLLSGMQLDIRYHLPGKAVYASASPELLQRAFYNLISNAVKFGTEQIAVSMTQTDSKAYISFINRTKKATNLLYNKMFARYKRTPGIEDPRNGLGLGMTLVHAIAKLHGGTVLVEMPSENEIKITISISTKLPKNSSFRSLIIKPDIYGGRDRALVELSDILPSEFYNANKF